MKRRLRPTAWDVCDHVPILFAIILLLGSQMARAQVQAPKTPSAPVARFFVLADLGQHPGDPIWQGSQVRIADGNDGYLYTTSGSGGTLGKGTVFKFSVTGGNPIVLYNFDGTHGAAPQGGLTFGVDDAFYGTTYGGGKYGVGTVFRITPSGALTVLWDFRNGVLDPPVVGRQPTEQELKDAAGSYPTSPPVMLAGTLYGVSSYANNQQYGVVYTMAGGGYRALYQFKPQDVAANGTFATSLSVGPGTMVSRILPSIWGTTLKGGLGWGTVFKLESGGISVVRKLDALSAGSLGVIEGSDGDLYGVASGGSISLGEVYRIDPATQALDVIHCFDGNDGAVPVGTPIQGSDGMLYGATKGGGRASRGVLYRLNPHPSDDHCTDPQHHPDQDADYAVLHHFDMNDGRYEMSPLIEVKAPGSIGMDFYGVADQGGAVGGGAIYHVNVRQYPKPSSDSFFQFGTRMTTDTMLVLTKGVSAYQGPVGAAVLKYSGGVTAQLFCPRDPHIVQFVMRTGTQADGSPATGIAYSTTWGSFKYGEWHTDAIGFPNAYYDQAPGAGHQNNLTSVTIFDDPSGTDPNRGPDPMMAHGWLFMAKDFAICNGKVVRTATWGRGAAWDPSANQLGPALYNNFQVYAPSAGEDPDAWSNTQLQWINDHLKADGYDPVP
jgi:uncharacterized repeat protein (TIGR03803 family)